MIKEIRLAIPADIYARLHSHLLGDRNREQAAFMFCGFQQTSEAARFACFDVHLVQHRQFAIHSEFHLELDDAVRARIIKSAHDHGCSLVEIHSHPWSAAAQFSGSDFMGLTEFVPHVWWRLRSRPYAALVATPTSVDGLAWIRGADAPERLHAIEVDDRVIPTTGLSVDSFKEMDGDALRQE